MKKYVLLGLTTLTILAVTLACRIPGLTPPAATEEPQATQVIVEAEPTATEDALPHPEPTATEDVSPSPEPAATDLEPTAGPSASPDNAGQIAYVFKGNLWRYLIDSNETIQVTTDGIPGDHMNRYGWPAFSPDGRYLAVNKGNGSIIYDLTNNTQIDITDYGQFFAWTADERQFFGVQGDFACPEIENLEDQILINFDILRFDLNDLANPTHLANIGGGLKFPVAISGDGQWTSIAHCACYSECGPENLWYLPTESLFTPPISLYPGSIDFSPDDTQLTVSQHQMHGYFQSPLYVANIDFSGMVDIFSIPDVAPINAQWSPDGEWIAFTGVVIVADDEFNESDRCVRLIRPDGSQEYVAECLSADFITWSPNGNQLLYSQPLGAIVHFYIYDLATSARTKLPFQADPYTLVAWGRLP